MRPLFMRFRDDQRAIGGFYEAIVALMVVTMGVLILTASMTFMSARPGENATARTCDRIMGSLLGNATIMLADRTIDGRALSHLDLSSVAGQWEGGLKVMLSYPDGRTEVLWEEGVPSMAERSSRSEAVNVRFSEVDVKAALLVVWTWP